VPKEPAELRGRIPSFEGDVFLVSHFDRGNINRLGGYFSAFARSPSQSGIAIDKDPDGKSALTFTFKNQLPGFAGFWIHLFNFKEPPSARYFLDASSFGWLTFSIRGEHGRTAATTDILQGARHPKSFSANSL